MMTDDSSVVGLAAAYSQDKRESLQKKGHAFKNSNGEASYPIPDVEHLRAAIRAFGRAKPGDRDRLKRFIIKRARELGATNLIPDSWTSTVSASNAEEVVIADEQNAVENLELKLAKTVVVPRHFRHTKSGVQDVETYTYQRRENSGIGNSLKGLYRWASGQSDNPHSPKVGLGSDWKRTQDHYQSSMGTIRPGATGYWATHKSKSGPETTLGKYDTLEAAASAIDRHHRRVTSKNPGPEHSYSKKGDEGQKVLVTLPTLRHGGARRDLGTLPELKHPKRGSGTDTSGGKPGTAPRNPRHTRGFEELGRTLSDDSKAVRGKNAKGPIRGYGKGSEIPAKDRAWMKRMGGSMRQAAMSAEDDDFSAIDALMMKLSADTARVSTVHSPLGKKDLWNTKGLQLPAYIQNIAKALMRDHGFTESHAIATAVNRVKKWAAGGGGVSPEVRAAAAKAVAEWEASKVRARATPNKR